MQESWSLRLVEQSEKNIYKACIQTFLQMWDRPLLRHESQRHENALLFPSEIAGSILNAQDLQDDSEGWPPGRKS